MTIAMKMPRIKGKPNVLGKSWRKLKRCDMGAAPALTLKIPLILNIGINRKIPIPSSKLIRIIPKRLIIRSFPAKAYNRRVKYRTCFMDNLLG